MHSARVVVVVVVIVVVTVAACVTHRACSDYLLPLGISVSDVMRGEDDVRVQDRGQRLQLLSSAGDRLICSCIALAFSDVSPLNCLRQKPLESHWSSAQSTSTNTNIMNNGCGGTPAGQCVSTRNLSG